MQLCRRVHSPTFDRAAHALVLALEALVMGVLALLVVLAIAGLIAEVAGSLGPPFLSGGELTAVLDDVLAVFVLIELLATAAAYLRGSDVMRRIFETLFIATARKLITLDLAGAPLAKAAALGILLTASGLAWWLVARANEDRSALPRPHGLGERHPADAAHGGPLREQQHAEHAGDRDRVRHRGGDER